MGTRAAAADCAARPARPAPPTNPDASSSAEVKSAVTQPAGPGACGEQARGPTVALLLGRLRNVAGKKGESSHSEISATLQLRLKRY